MTPAAFSRGHKDKGIDFNIGKPSFEGVLRGSFDVSSIDQLVFYLNESWAETP